MLYFVFDLFHLVFWWTIFRTFQLVRYMFVILVPDSVIRKGITKVFGQYRVKFTMDDESPGKYDKDLYDCEFIIHNPKFFKAVAANDFMAIGESYMVRTFPRFGRPHWVR